jgi:hypothetical protein
MGNMKAQDLARVMVIETAKNVHTQKEKAVVKTDHAEVLEMEKENHL